MTKINKVVQISINPQTANNYYSLSRASDKDLVFKDIIPDCSDYKIIEYGDIPDEPESKYKFKKSFDEVKTYYFIPSTKFDRDYFKRLYPNLKYTRIIKNADIIIYDNVSFTKNFLKVINSKNYGYYSSRVNDILYIHEGYGVERVLSESLNPNIKKLAGQQNHKGYYFAAESISDEYLGKLVHIDKILDKLESSLLVKDLDKDTCLTLLSQVMSDNVGTKKACVDTILSYKGYEVTKKILISFVGKITSLGSTKLDFYIKSLGGKRELYTLDYYGNPFFKYIEFVSEDIKNATDKKDKELATMLLNSKKLHDYWLSGIKIPIKIELLQEEAVSAENTESKNISEFLI